jgi:hypothetical protein
MRGRGARWIVHYIVLGDEYGMVIVEAGRGRGYVLYNRT